MRLASKEIYIHKGEECYLTGRTASRKGPLFAQLAKFGLEAPDEQLVEIRFIETERSRSGCVKVRNDWVVNEQLYKLDK